MSEDNNKKIILYPGSYQQTPYSFGGYLPSSNLYQSSGNIDTSSAREFYDDYKKKYEDSSEETINLKDLALSINFILIMDEMSKKGCTLDDMIPDISSEDTLDDENHYGKLFLNQNCFSNAIRGHSNIYGLDNYTLRIYSGTDNKYPKLVQNGETMTGHELLYKLMNNGNTGEEITMDKIMNISLHNNHTNCSSCEYINDEDEDE